ncbi:MAG TPA: DUF1569 domain-containing protein [Tepidisphaeraceae bacterium]|nr:DUF1569 domain-containing protein [Tepidisphaeraceae bacterium]
MAEAVAALVAKPARRTLRFDTIDDALAEAERLAAAEREGRLRRAGNWTLGQTLGHLATWASFALEGYPDAIRPPAPVRAILRLFKGRVLKKGMTPGMRLGRHLPEGTVGTDVLSTEEGLRRFSVALQRLRATVPTIDNPVFGKLTHEEWVQLNLRHAELHLGFQVPGEGQAS